VRTLIVQEGAEDRRVLRTYLEDRGFEVIEAGNGLEALRALESNPPDLVISDGLTRDMDGFDLLAAMQASNRLRRIPFVFYSHICTDAREAQFAATLGAAAFIIKGTPERQFWAKLDNALESTRLPYGAAISTETADEHPEDLSDPSSALTLRLMREVAELRRVRTAQEKEIGALERAEADLLDGNALHGHMVFDVAEAMGKIAEARDPYTQGHQDRVARIGKMVAQEMGLSETDVDTVEMAALIHDVGKLAVPFEILTKPGTLTSPEHTLMEYHPQRSFEFLKDIAFPWPIADVALQHHERMDGSGYPSGLKGDDILLPSRILAAADVIEAMTSARPHRPALGVDAAIAEITSDNGKYDPMVAQACRDLRESGHLNLLASA